MSQQQTHPHPRSQSVGNKDRYLYPIPRLEEIVDPDTSSITQPSVRAISVSSKSEYCECKSNGVHESPYYQLTGVMDPLSIVDVDRDSDSEYCQCDHQNMVNLQGHKKFARTNITIFFVIGENQ